MTQIELIKAEIERLAETLPEVRSIMEGLLSFINSLPQEQPSEDLEKAAEEYAGVNYDCETETDAFYHHIETWAFKAGAQWQKEKEREYSPWLSIQGLKDASLEFAQQAKDYEIGGQTWTEDMAVAFTRGAQWQKEQMMKDAQLANPK